MTAPPPTARPIAPGGGRAAGRRRRHPGRRAPGARGSEIGVAVSGEEGIEAFAPLADHLIAVEPQVELVEQWDEARGAERMRALG
jgi:hypothetical protein